MSMSAGFLDRSDGKLSLFILNRDLSKAHDVEVVWEDAAPARVISAIFADWRRP